MSPEVVLSLCLLVPLIYAGLYMLSDPSSSVRVLNKLMADAHRIEASTLLGDLFAEPRPLDNTHKTRIFMRVAGVGIMVAGLLRLYSL